MKRIITLFALLFILFTNAQQNIDVPNSLTVNEANYMLENVARNGFEIMVQGDAKDIRKSFEDYLEDNYDFKIKSSGGLLKGEELMSIKISEKRFNLYSLVKEDGEGNHLRLWLAPGMDIYFKSSSDLVEANAAKNILKSFVKEYYGSFLNEKLEDTNDEIEDINKDLKGFVKTEQSAKKDIAKTEKRIAKAESKLKKTQEKIQSLESDIKELEGEKTEYANEIETYTKTKNEAQTKISTVTEKLNEKETLRQKQKVNLEKLKVL